MAEAKASNFDDSMLEPFLGQLRRAPKDKDRLRLIKQVVQNYMIKCDDAAEMLRKCEGSAGRVEAAVLIFSSIADPENFEEMVQSVFKFSDERENVKKQTIGCQ